MKTPICDFLKSYAQRDAIRLHMPGHKGKEFLGFEQYDITEIDGADSLYSANGIIEESEKNASALFGSSTYYSTEGSSQCIRAMLALCSLYAKIRGRKAKVLAARNAHKAFHSAAALLDFDVDWLCAEKMDNYLSCALDADYLDKYLDNGENKPTALYVTSPDYLGNVADITSISRVCRKHGVLLLVDNAHGAYLRFLSPSEHPIDLGADICCDSAHKTLPVLTGGAYLHLSDIVANELGVYVKDALQLFGSTSPSYIILASLDAANAYLESHRTRLSSFIEKVDALKSEFESIGYSLCGNEALKITLQAKKYGYYGFELARLLEEKGVVCEFSDSDFLVMMLTPENESELDILKNILASVPKREVINELPPLFIAPKRVISIREAYLSSFEKIDVENALGRIAALSCVGCPPAVPIVMSGEIVDENAIKCFKYYGINKINVIK